MMQKKPWSCAAPTLQQKGLAKCTGMSQVPVSLNSSSILILVGTAASVTEQADEFQLGMWIWIG